MPNMLMRKKMGLKYAKGGFIPFEKKSESKKDTPAVFKKFGKEGSAREEAFDKKEGMACGGKVKGKSGGGLARGGGAATRGKGFAGDL